MFKLLRMCCLKSRVNLDGLYASVEKKKARIQMLTGKLQAAVTEKDFAGGELCYSSF